jgi:flagellin-like hook-associated protein FlgL
MRECPPWMPELQQAGTAVLAQANTSQQSVLKLLGG